MEAFPVMANQAPSDGRQAARGEPSGFPPLASAELAGGGEGPVFD